MTRSRQVTIYLLLMCLPCWPAAAFQYTTNDNDNNSWESYAPGRLLYNLDKLTHAAVEDEPLTMPTTTTTTSSTTPATSIAHRKADENEKDDSEVDRDDRSTELQQDDVDDGDDISGVDYERTYEQFVRKYFDRADDDDTDADAHLAAGNDDTSADSQSASIETHVTEDNEDDYEPVPKASTVRAKHERCKKVRRNKQQCEICKNPRNNEVSETCSYSHENTPQKYAYGSEKQYKRYKDDESDEVEPEDVQVDDSNSREDTKRRRSHANSDTAKSRRLKPQLQSEPSSLCVRKLLRQKVCYHCKDSTGKKLSRCYDVPRTHKRRNAAEQRIYKRTVAYATYEQATTNDTEATTTTTPTAPAEQNNTNNGSAIVLDTLAPAPPPTVPSLPNAAATGFRHRHTLYKVVRKQQLN